jgi:hypothetical protein
MITGKMGGDSLIVLRVDLYAIEALTPGVLVRWPLEQRRKWRGLRSSRYHLNRIGKNDDRWADHKGHAIRCDELVDFQGLLFNGDLPQAAPIGNCNLRSPLKECHVIPSELPRRCRGVGVGNRSKWERPRRVPGPSM